MYAVFYYSCYLYDNKTFFISKDIQQERLLELQLRALTHLKEQAAAANVGFSSDTVTSPIDSSALQPRELVVRVGQDSLQTSDPRLVRALIRKHHRQLRATLFQEFWVDSTVKKRLVPFLGNRPQRDSGFVKRTIDSLLSLDSLALENQMHQLGIGLPVASHRNVTIHTTHQTLDLVVGNDTIHISDSAGIPALVQPYLESAVRNKVVLPWNLLDFLYFSTQTVTGGGFGDIVPNSTIVRVAVIGQTVLGYLLVVAVLNIVIIALTGSSERAGHPRLLRKRKNMKQPARKGFW